MWYKLTDKHLEIFVYAKPNAKQTKVVQATDTSLHIAIHAKPDEGKANLELIKFVAKLFGVPKTDVKLLKGKSSRNKVLLLPLLEPVIQLIKQSQW
ncbi:DUF167 domain-containing protein [Legionella waltersii]|uniref:UPF0235 protein Lwal_1391 n=1 Tax=Legionella waltersii TaxID=66969 RepID=A0A0W1ADC6_9GAMM|nr:DUF167 domain-containing protein [Legionella waltersii]KTD79319.1 hypothetical protein Lwal_1391 [Legionella waltersii]SNV13043.1 Uncharacterised ACR, YggU family COG1872 [Legionella waltersii]